MARDRRPQARRRTRKRTLPGWVWLFTGVLIGLFIAFVVYLNDRYPAPLIASQSKQSTGTKDKRRAEQTAPPQRPPASRYDFYTLLPEMEVEVPVEQDDPSSQATSSALQTPGTYVLQAGSFRQHDEADRLKATLALLGVEAHIERVTINNRDIWHRVRIGPYDDLDELNRIRRRLKQNQIPAILLKLKG